MRFLAFTWLFTGILLCWAVAPAVAQKGNIATLQLRVQELQQKVNYKKDTAWLKAVNNLAFSYAEKNPDSALQLLQQHDKWCREAGYHEGEASVYINTGVALYNKGDYAASIESLQKGVERCKQHQLTELLPKALNNLGLTAMAQGNFSRALQYYYETLAAAEAVKDQYTAGSTHNNIAIIHYYQNRPDEAELNYKKFLNISVALHDTDGIVIASNNIGEIYLDKNDFATARHYFTTALTNAALAGRIRSLISANKNLGLLYFKSDSLAVAARYFKQAADLALEAGYKPSACVALTGLANTLHRQGKSAEALSYGQQALVMAEEMGQPQLMRDANEVLASVYEQKGDGLQALAHYRRFKQYADSLRNTEAERMSERLKAEFDFSKKELEYERTNLQQRWWIFSAFAALFSALLVIFLVYRSRQKEKTANRELQQKNNIIEHQKSIAEEALEQLKSTQKQLIQSEKMASLGELTAGIAHEIQNPLNFVNNFSEVSADLVRELVEEADKGNTAEVKGIADDLIGNLEKIAHHGERASSIVKGMLQHSRSGSGVKEPTDINALCDEYLRLAYHGFRAKDKSFRAGFSTDFDPHIGKVKVVPQEIGRVVLNLINNAFYAVSEKAKAASLGDESYEPLVSVTTKKGTGAITITIADNGTGIPRAVIDKIFQPFFTTKPTGQGTGLGLSLSYDIVTKGHSGSMQVETKEKEGTTFIVHLPNSQS
ncbi:MAG TPA: tetratricopeptide repeat protein [Lacibacter sp.]|nr:tetratricopeptide repeat protein [Lacibacter sp.]HMO90192.1 tetratricopeptide repeat protein [Lacibacter sp.]